MVIAKPLHRADLLCPTKRSGLPVLGPVALVAMKVGTASSADIRDILELLEAGQVPVDEVATRLCGDELDRFQALVTIAELEKVGRPKESRRILVELLAKSAPARSSLVLR